MPAPGPQVPSPQGREVWDLLSEGIAFFDADGRFSTANPALRERHPDLAEFLSARTPWDVLLNEAQRRQKWPATLCHALRVAEDQLASGTQTAIDIEPVPGIQASYRLVNLADGGFALLERWRANPPDDVNSIRDAEALLRKVLEACTVCLTMSRIGDGAIIYRSPAATDLLGPARSSFDHFARRTDRADFVTALLPEGRVDDMPVEGLRPDGTAFPARISARLIDYGGEDVIVSAIEDLTAEVEVEAELARTREQVFQAEKMSALGELLASVAHELNNPLSIILGNAALLNEELQGTAYGPRIGKLSAAAERCVGIVRSFLSMARERPLSIDTVPLSDIVAIATEATQALLSEAGVLLEPTIDAEIRLKADKVQLAQVVINLITNAAHAIQETSSSGSIRLRTQPGRSAEMITFAVEDDGPGVPADIRNRIFDPLFTTKEPGKGTGVGLAFCLRVVEAHGGKLWLDKNQPDRGARFVLDLPLDS